jgi:hypothetical protein
MNLRDRSSREHQGAESSLSIASLLRGDLPEFVTCPQSGAVVDTGKGTVPKKSHFACGACGAVQDVLDSIKATKKTGPVAGYAIQGYCPNCGNGWAAIQWAVLCAIP